MVANDGALGMGGEWYEWEIWMMIDKWTSAIIGFMLYFFG